MIHDMTLPQLAMGMSEGTVVEWLVTEGNFVDRDQPLLSIETEKVVTEIPAPRKGYVHIVVPVGETVPVDTVIAQFSDSGDDFQWHPSSAPQVAPAAALGAEAPIRSTDEGERRRVVASGLAKKIARDADLDLKQLTGSGPRGRVVKRDVVAAMEARSPAVPAQPQLQLVAATQSAPTMNVGVRKIPLVGMRRAIADKMVQAVTIAAPTHVYFEVNVSKLSSVREIYLGRETQLGTRVSMIALYTKALGLALKAVPICNSTLQNDEISVWETVNVGIAVALPGKNEIDSGLIVPVLKDVNSKGIVEIDREIKELVRKARNQELSAADVSGGTVTLASTSGFYPAGWSVSSPILTLPQVVSFQPGSIIRKPVVEGESIVIRDMLPCSITFDHRALDGEPAGRLVTQIGDYLSHPELMLL